MRIGQAIDEITRDVCKEFISGELIMFWDFRSCQIVIRNTGNGMVLHTVLINKHFNLEWELVQKPVTFMEVVESGKPFRVEHSILGNWNYGGITQFLDEIVRTLGCEGKKIILTEGKFYIKEDN